MKSLIKVSVVVLLLSILFLSKSEVEASSLSKFQKRNADKIAKITAENYKRYGVLPSVAVGQAMGESSLGKHAPGYNYWGLASGRIHCYSLENGVIKYLKCINNGYYKGAPFNKNWRSQIEHIGPNYCNGGSYVHYIKGLIIRHNFTKYDKQMFKAIKKEKRLKAKLKAKKKRLALKRKKARLAKIKKQKEEAARKKELEEKRSGEFTLKYDSTVPEGKLGISGDVADGSESVTIDTVNGKHVSMTPQVYKVDTDRSFDGEFDEVFDGIDVSYTNINKGAKVVYTSSIVAKYSQGTTTVTLKF